MITPTPLLDFFKRGEVARDIRLQAAEGTFAPRAHEQLGILVLLTGDADPEIRRVAESTLSRIPRGALTAFLGRSHLPAGLLEFFAARGIVPSGRSDDEDEEPLIDTDTEPESLPENAPPEVVSQRIHAMGIVERMRAAVKGTREMRAILIRDSNKLVATAVLSSPKLSESEVESFARMPNVTEDVLRIIGGTRSWMKNYSVVVGLTRNPKTPLAVSMNLLSRLRNRDLAIVSLDRNVPDLLRFSARRRVVLNNLRG